MQTFISPPSSDTSLAVTQSHAFVVCTKSSIRNKPCINIGIFHSEAMALTYSGADFMQDTWNKAHLM